MTLDPADRQPELWGPVRAAADALTSSIEEQAQDIVTAAQQRADELEREAERAARRIEQDAKRNAERILQAAFERAEAVLDTVDVIESGLTGMAYGIRLQAHDLARALTVAAEGVAPQLSAGPVPAPAIAPDDDQDGAGLPERSAAMEPSLPLISTDQLRKLMRAIIQGMRREERPREDAQRFLMHFGLEGILGELLDQVYASPEEGPVAPPAPRKKRGLRRGASR